MIKSIVVLGLLVGCKGGDKCERAWDKMAPAMAAEQKTAKPQAQPPDRAAMVADCKAELVKHPEREAMLDCVIAIDGEVTMDKLAGCASAKGKGGEGHDRHRTTEAALQLNKIGKNAKRIYAETAAFPKGKVGLTPATECCAGPDHKCTSDAKSWTDPVWTAMEFQIDEPFRYRYSYESDGQTFTATAVGDPDCDGKPGTFTLTGSVENGNPKVQLKEPAQQ